MGSAKEKTQVHSSKKLQISRKKLVIPFNPRINADSGSLP